MQVWIIRLGQPYHPSSPNEAAFTLSAPDGTLYQLNGFGEVLVQIATNGTRLYYSDSGITASTGETIRFVKDAIGRLTSITAPDGTKLVYRYDLDGQLIAAQNLQQGTSTRYGYAEERLILVTGEPGVAIVYGATPVISPVMADLGSASQFTGALINGSVTNRSLYSFSLRDSELESTATGMVLLSVEVQGNNLLPKIVGKTPVASRTTADSAFALFGLQQSGLKVLELNGLGDVQFKLEIAGDLNRDGKVDGVDLQLFSEALSGGNYTASFDLNRDGVLSGADLQILGSNYGFSANRAPIVRGTSVLTHEDLGVSIPIGTLASDPEGDTIFWKIVNPVNGTVILREDGTARFKPNVGYTGLASFELTASDEFSTSESALVTINVSDAPLLSLDFVERNPKFGVGEQMELKVIGDFADQEDVILPGDYLNWFSENATVASVSGMGIITGLSNGTTVLTVSRGEIQAVTASRVGTLPIPTNRTELRIALAENYGLSVYPRRITLTEGITRQLLVGLTNNFEESNLINSQTGTRYFVSNPKILTISQDGLITTLEEGNTQITVINGAAEEVIPVRVEKPHLGATTLGTDGGIVQASDGSLVMIPELALLENTTVNLTPLNANNLSLPIPDGFNLAGAFKLDLGEEDSLLLPAQIIIPAPADLSVGSEVYFMRKGEMPDETGTWQPMWILEESGKVMDDRTIRTSSPPYPGMYKEGEYVVLASSPTGSATLVKGRLTVTYEFPPAFYGVIIPPSFTSVGAAGGAFGMILKTFSDFKNPLIRIVIKIIENIIDAQEKEEKIDRVAQYIKDSESFDDLIQRLSQEIDLNEIVDRLLELAEDLGLTDTDVGGLLLNTSQYFSIPAFQVSYDISSVKVVQVPSVGLPIITTANVELNPDGLRTFETTLNLPSSSTASDPFAPPILQKAQLKFVNNQPLIALTGYNFVGASAVSNNSSTQDLIVNFQVGDQIYKQTVSSLNDLGNNLFEIQVEPLNTFALGQARIFLTRSGAQQTGPEPNDVQTVEYKSNPIQIEAETGYVFSTVSDNDQVAVFEGVNPEAIVEATNSNDLLKAKIPVGTPDIFDRPRDLAITKDGSRAYVTLEGSGRVALIDPLLLQQIDTQPTTTAIDPIELPVNARPISIAIDQRDQFAYIADGQFGFIYVLDINPSSETYHQVVKNIQVNPAPVGLRQLAISSDGKKLFATAPNPLGVGKSSIIVINIDPEDRPLNPSQNNNKWHEQIGTVAAEDGVEGITASSNPNLITFTNRRSEASGYGVLKITNSNPLQFAATTYYSELGLGSFMDYFDVNEAVSIALTKDGKYAFVAGYNGSRFGSGIESIDGVQAGGNIGIIANPLGANPLLVAATRPIPMGLTSDLVLSNDGRYLYASYPTNGGVYVFDVEEILKTLDTPSNYLIDQFGRGVLSPFFNLEGARPARLTDLVSVPIDDINPAISIAADFGIIAEDRARNQFTYGPLPETNRAPVNPGAFSRGLAVAPTDIVDLTGPGNSTSDLTPTFTWKFDIPIQNVQEVNLFVSTFTAGEGLLPWDVTVDLDDPQFLPGMSESQKRQLLTKKWRGYDDFNPGRILTATWKKATNTWYWYDGQTVISQTLNEPPNTSIRLTLPESLTLTAGQDYHWAVQAISTTGETDTEYASFRTTAPLRNSPFSSVSILTHGFSPPILVKESIPDNFYELGNKIIQVNGNLPDQKGLMMRYDKPTGMWVPVDRYGRILSALTGGLLPDAPSYLTTLATQITDKYLGQNKPLVLLSEWVTDGESSIPDSGFSEGAADAIFAALVQLDQALGGGVGEKNSLGELVRLYDEQGKLIRHQGAVFNSPLHFIGFSRGAVVNSEMIQRVGTDFPHAGGPVDENGESVKGLDGKPIRDLQMTTIDPHDFAQESLKIDLVIPNTTIAPFD